MRLAAKARAVPARVTADPIQVHFGVVESGGWADQMVALTNKGELAVRLQVGVKSWHSTSNWLAAYIGWLLRPIGMVPIGMLLWAASPHPPTGSSASGLPWSRSQWRAGPPLCTWLSSPASRPCRGAPP